MSTTRKLIVAFWIFIAIMLIWQFYTYNQGLTHAATDHPQQQHFYFLHTNTPAATSAQAHKDGADIRQTHFEVQDNTPGTGNFTCLVTLKNVGNAKGINVQVSVRPYRGVSNFDPDVGGGHGGPLSEDDPISQLNSWLSYPDLAPGESSTRSVVFLKRDDYSPGQNPNPQIVFDTEKPAPQAPHKPAE